LAAAEFSHFGGGWLAEFFFGGFSVLPFSGGGGQIRRLTRLPVRHAQHG